MTITAKEVMDLRAATGMPMMQCKRALEAEGGDFEKAVDRLRKEGAKAVEKRADRTTKEGLVRIRVADDHRRATLVALGCETEPVARLDMFQDFAERLVDQVEQASPASVDDLMSRPWKGGTGETVEQALTDLVAKINENIRVVTLAQVAADAPGVVGGYLHHDQKHGAIVSLAADQPDPELAAFARQLCMHIVFARPAAVTRDEVPESVTSHELEIIRGQVNGDPRMKGKPPQVVEKVVEGKLAAFFKQAVLTEQVWALPGNEETVGQMLAARRARIVAFHRAQLGG